MISEEDLENYYKLFEIIAKIRVKGFLPKSINIGRSLTEGMVITPFNEEGTWGVASREITIKIEDGKKVKVIVWNDKDTLAKQFAEEIKALIMVDDALNTLFLVEIKIVPGVMFVSD